MELQFPIAITKMSGAGNDFVVIDHRSQTIPPQLQPQFAQAVCRRRFSVGADGLILIEPSESVDFSWRFYNSDGSVAEMCGNGARCAARFAYRHGIADRRMRFDTVAGIIEAEIIGEQEHVSVKVTEPGPITATRPILLDGVKYDLYRVNTGVPHAVLFVDPEGNPVREWGRTIRYHQQFEPAGTNVNFVRETGAGDLHVTTYERGVEDLTLACGTGVVAAALVAAGRGLVESPVYVTTAGGEQLAVLFERDEERFSEVFLQGAARFVYEGRLLAEALL